LSTGGLNAASPFHLAFKLCPISAQSTKVVPRTTLCYRVVVTLASTAAVIFAQISLRFVGRSRKSEDMERMFNAIEKEDIRLTQAESASHAQPDIIDDWQIEVCPPWHHSSFASWLACLWVGRG
jgi:hypothetical protein